MSGCQDTSGGGSDNLGHSGSMDRKNGYQESSNLTEGRGDISRAAHHVRFDNKIESGHEPSLMMQSIRNERIVNDTRDKSMNLNGSPNKFNSTNTTAGGGSIGGKRTNSADETDELGLLDPLFTLLLAYSNIVIGELLVGSLSPLSVFYD